jgi:type IV pilus assembly protein PilY1
VCTQYQNQQTGTTQVCNSFSTVPVYDDVCVQYQTVTVQTTCAVFDPTFVRPPANLTADPLTPARYYRYEGPVPASDDDLATIGNYRMVEVDRAVGGTFPVPVDPRTGAVRGRNDCAQGNVCTLVEEMQNYANWFTYYRHRLFAAIAVTSQAASDLKGDLSALRLGYGRINYFDNGPDPWNPYGARLNGALFPSLDNDPSPPPHPGAGARRARLHQCSEQRVAAGVLRLVFSLNWIGSTPNREAINSIGTYYRAPATRPGRITRRRWRPHGDLHAACRQFAILTDGEWTAIPETPPIPPAQPLISNMPADPVGAGNGTVTGSLATTGPQITGSGLYQNVTYNYDPSVEVQYSTNNSGVTQTLTDAALYWWNRDLRPTVPNAVQKRPNRPDDSFWQSMTTFIVGYGLNATMDTPAVRAQVAAGQAVAWPIVDTNPSLTTGGERVNDTMRAALSTRGDFYSANDPTRCAAGSAVRSVRLHSRRSRAPAWFDQRTAHRRFDAVPRRSRRGWTGNLQAFDVIAAASGQNAQPEPVLLRSPLPQWNVRNIATSTAMNTALPSTATTRSRRPADGPDLVDVMDYVRGGRSGRGQQPRQQRPDPGLAFVDGARHAGRPRIPWRRTSATA